MDWGWRIATLVVFAVFIVVLMRNFRRQIGASNDRDEERKPKP